MEVTVQRVERLARDGVFGKGEFMRVDVDREEGTAQYASQVKFLKVILKTDQGNVKEHAILVKYQLDDSTREFMGTDIQFFNEVTMYEKILPDLHTTDLGIHPTMFYGVATVGKDPQQDFVVLEDLRPQGFKLAKDIFLDYEHISLTLNKLGKFHGLSYKMKRSSPETLRGLADLLLPKKLADFGDVFKSALLRGFQPFLESDPVAKRAFEKLTSVDSSNLWLKLQKAEEPFGIIVHGDFNRNNVFYKYDDEKVVDVIFFDFATAVYSDPAIDIAFFMYMNISPELRAERWDDFLKIYWEGLMSVEADPGFSFNEFLHHFAKRAVYGYIPCSFFLPMMLFPEAQLPPEEFLKLSPEEQKDWALNSAGEKATLVVSSIVRHLIDKGYLDDPEWF